MKRSKFSEEQIAYVLRQVEAALEVGGLLKLLKRLYTPREEDNNP